jgi:hypothetical protein
MPQQMLDTFLDSIASPALKAVASHWLAARGDRLMPSWQQIKPSQIAPHLPILWAYRYDRDTGQFTGRLAGQRFGWGMDRKFGGATLKELHSPDSYPKILANALRLVEGPALSLCQGRLFRQGDRFGSGERISLPLSEDGQNCDGLLGASQYQYPVADLKFGPVEILVEDERHFALRAA